MLRRVYGVGGLGFRVRVGVESGSRKGIYGCDMWGFELRVWG